MSTQTIPEIIAAKRNSEGLSSLNELEQLTGKNRATILRYERGEAPIPKDVIQVFAKKYFKEKNERSRFIDQWNEEITSLAKDRQNKSKRSKERTKAQAFYDVEIHINPITAHPHDLIEADEDGSAKVVGRDTHYRYAGSWVHISIVHKPAKRPLFRIDPTGYCFISYTSNKKKFLYKFDAVDALIKHAAQYKIGKYAVMDLAKKALETSDIFKSAGKKPFLILDKKVMKELHQLLKKAQDAKGYDDAMEYIDKAKIQMDFLNDQGRGLANMRASLLKKISAIEARIDHKLSPSSN